MRKYLLLIATLLLLEGALTAQVPDFTQTDCNGVTHHLYDDLSAGKAVILNFCAGWCTPCRQSDPRLDTLYRQFSSGNCKVNVYGFIFETNTPNEPNTDCNFSKAYATRGGLTFPVFANIGDYATGITGSYFKQYDIQGTPAFIVILPNADDPANSQVKIIVGDAIDLVQQFKDTLALGGFFAPTITVDGNLCSALPFTAQLSSNFASGYHWSTNETSQSITVTQSGTYSVSNGLGCSASLDVTFNQPPVAGAATISATTLCANGVYTLDYTIPPGATTDVTWEYQNADNSWSELGPAGAGPITLEGDAAGGSEVFRVRASAVSCPPAYSNLLSISFTGDAPGAAQGTASTSSSSFDCKPYTLSYSGNEPGALWEFYDYTEQYWFVYGPADQGPVNIAAANDPGSENGVLSDKWRVAIPTNSCYNISNSVIIAIKTSSSLVISTDCKGGLTATATTGYGIASYLWSPGGATTPSIANAKENVDYTVQITDQNGCASTTTQRFDYIPVNPNPVIKADTIGPICSGSPAQIAFAGTMSVPACTNSSNGQFPAGAAVDVPVNTTVNITEAGLAGQYSLINVAAGNMYDFASLNTADGNLDNDNVTITGTNGTTVYTTGKGFAEWFAGFTGQVRFYTNGIGCITDNNLRIRGVSCFINWTDYNIFNWLPDGETSPTFTVNPTATTNYSLNYLDLIGCQGTASLSVSVAAPHSYYVDKDGDGYGSGASVILCAATAPAGYSTNNTDCNDNDANVHAIPTISISHVAALCSGNTTQINASSNAVSPAFSWYSDAAGQNLLQSGASATYTTPVLNSNATYYVSVADGSASCASTLASATVTVKAFASIAPITSSGGSTVCSGATITLADATAGGKWSASSNAASVSTKGVVVFATVAATTTVTLYYTVTGNGCSASVNIPFTINAPLAVKAITGTTSICGTGGTTTLSDATSGGSWSSLNTGIATVANATGVVTGKTAGTAKITYSISSGGCTASTSITVTVKASPTVAAITGNNVLIKGSSISFSDATKGGVWSSSNTAIASVSSGGSVKGVSAGACTIYYTVTSGSCTVVASKSITIYNPLSASVVAGKILCNGGTASLTINVTGGSGGYQYSLNGGKFQAGNIYTVPAGTYLVVVKDNMAEQFTISGIIISQPAAPGIKLVSETNVSSKGSTNGSFTVTGSGGTAPYQYSINGTTYQSSGSFTGKAAGAYAVYVKDACNAKNKLNVTIGTGTKRNAEVTEPATELHIVTDENDDSEAAKAVIYPNPSVTGFTLELKSSTKETVEIVVMDVMGHTLYHTRGDATGSYKFGENFIKGMYFVEVLRKNGINTLKVVKQ